MQADDVVWGLHRPRMSQLPGEGCRCLTRQPCGGCRSGCDVLLVPKASPPWRTGREVSWTPCARGLHLVSVDCIAVSSEIPSGSSCAGTRKVGSRAEGPLPRARGGVRAQMEERNYYGHGSIAEAFRRKSQSFPEVAQKGGDTSGHPPWVFVRAALPWAADRLSHSCCRQRG